MSISELRDEFQERLAHFLWDQWAQMGVSANGGEHDPWAADPEALLLLTFEVGRGEPRLFDEVLDWMLINERLLSAQRLRNLALDDEDQRLVEAVLGWLGQNRRRPRLGAKQETLWADREPEPLFRGSRLEVRDPDPAFLARGFLKPRAEPSGKSQAPDLRLPINFAFRLRLLLGIGVRAEVMRVLLTVVAPWINAQTLAAMTTYTKRNVQEATGALASAGVARAWTVGNENRFSTSREDWDRFLELDAPIRHEDWPQLFRSCRVILRWLVDPAGPELSDYMLSSRMRSVAETVEPDLLFAGIPIASANPPQDFASFERFVQGLLPN
jgi:hypothetical protein